jgi:hypothetical protein
VCGSPLKLSTVFRGSRFVSPRLRGAFSTAYQKSFNKMWRNYYNAAAACQAFELPCFITFLVGSAFWEVFGRSFLVLSYAQGNA